MPELSLENVKKLLDHEIIIEFYEDVANFKGTLRQISETQKCIVVRKKYSALLESTLDITIPFKEIYRITLELKSI